jgi:hypothetical protein
MVAEREAVTVFVVTLSVALVFPAAIVTVAGTVAEALLLDKDTETPPAGATPLKVTVPVEDVPPVTLGGFTESEERATVIAGVTMSAAVLLTPL